MMYERGCLVLLSLFLCANPQFVLDRLSPYEEDFHGSLHRSVRSVAECQSKEWGNTTYDNYDLQIPVPKSVNILYDVHRFSDKVESNLHNIYSVHRRRYLMGSIAFLKDPYYAVSVLEPLKPSGCQIKYYSASRGTVRNTVHNRVNGCTVAVNAGYFSMKNGRCLGNVVSDGRIVQVSNEMNANFGIRQDGSVVVGYISTEEVRTGSFRQLVSGVIWLVRNGRNNVNESMKVECAANQNTGKMATFVNVLSARTALGLDKDGRVVVAHVDGQTHTRGANLYEFADLLINHGVQSAINLDGGGSSTFVHKDVVINYPSDHCTGNPAYRCERRVSTVLCFHDVQCLEPTCNNHGNCTNGQCSCYPPWTGLDCGQLNCTIENCTGRGNCSNGVKKSKGQEESREEKKLEARNGYCTCVAGWGGSRCSQECSPNTYGPGCKSKCHCYGRSICDKFTGKCKCHHGYTGFGCWRECPLGFYGDKCAHRCPTHNCSGHGKCSRVDGRCICAANWTGTTCNQATSVSTSITSHINKEKNSMDFISPSSNSTLVPQEKTFSSSTSEFLSSSSSVTDNQSRGSGTLLDQQCSTNAITSGTGSNRWLFQYLFLGAVTALCVSIMVHVIICMKIRGQQKKHVNLKTLLTRRKPRRKRKRTQVPQHSSSSDCSI